MKKSKKNVMKNVKIILVNILIVLLVLTSLTLYMKRQNKEKQITALRNYENTTVGMEKIVASYIVTEQQLVNTWAKSINGKKMTLYDAYLFLNTSIKDGVVHIILQNDYSQGITSKPNAKGDYSLSYLIYDNKIEYRYSSVRAMDLLRTNQNEIKMTPVYIDPESGEKVVAFCQNVVVYVNGVEENAFLLNVLPIRSLMERWVFATNYKDVDIVLIEKNGDYVSLPKYMTDDNFNFYDFIYNRYNILPDSIRRSIFGNKIGSFEAIGADKQKVIYSYTIMEETDNHAIIMSIPSKEINLSVDSTGVILITMIALSIAIIFNALLFKEATKNEFQQLEIIKSQEKQLKQALVSAQQANKAKTIFLNSMSHDIRTPMNAIIGFTSLALTHIDDTPTVQDYLKKIMTSSEHLLSLINDVLDMSRIESGKVKIELNEENLPEVMQDLRNILLPEIKAKDLNFYIDLVDVVHEKVICDKLRLNQILINLVSNAIKFTEPGGKVGISVIEKSSDAGLIHYEFHVKDNGIGMSEEFVKHIFEPFTREETSTVSRIQGSGLGMSITKNIIELMNGTISVVSKQGEGSEFIVSLVFRTAEKEVNVNIPEATKGLKALVVDERMDCCINHSNMLKRLGLRSEWTTSGDEAVFRTKISMDEKDPFDVYLIDEKVLNLSGFDIAKKIRNYTENRDVRIFLTVEDTFNMSEKCKEAGVNFLCSKPLFLSGLSELLQGGNFDDKKIDDEEIYEPEKYKGKRVLLADDVDLNREIVVEILHEAGIQVEACENGKEAVEMLVKSKPGYFDLVLMDVMMPVMDGYEATKMIRNLENKELADIPIIAMTAKAFDEDRKMALEAGMNDHLSKPLEIKKLYKIMSHYF